MGSNASKTPSEASTAEEHNNALEESQPTKASKKSSNVEVMMGHPSYSFSASQRIRERLSKIDDVGDNDKSRFSMKLWCVAHRVEVGGLLLVLLGVIVVLLTLLLPKRNSGEETAGKDGSFPAGQDPTLAAPVVPWLPLTPEPAPNQQPTPASPVAAPTPAAQPATSPPPTNPRIPVLSLYERLSEIVPDPDILRQSETPQGRAFQWLSRIDEHPHTSDVSQRFVLAALYFATGGRRTSATWKYCSAVPSTTQSPNTFSTRCVFEDGIHVCAALEDFEECPEYYLESDNTSMPTDPPKKRWVSLANECDWFGVICNDDGRVEQLILPNNGLVGTLIPELGVLTSLKVMNLATNDFSGGPLPELSSAFQQLHHVSLSDCVLEGAIPLSWSASFASSTLQTLDLSTNNLNGTVQLPHMSSSSSSISLPLKSLILADNPLLQISMTPQVGLWTQLETLDLSGTTLVGERIPGTMGNWRDLRRLNLANTGMVGAIPPEVAALTELVTLQLQSNHLDGTLPIGLWQLVNLEQLRLDDNRFSGTLSTMIGHLTSLTEINLERSGLTGDFPESVANLESLEVAYFHYNEFTGRVPQDVCNLPHLSELTADCDRQGTVECTCCTLCCSLRRDRCREI